MHSGIRSEAYHRRAHPAPIQSSDQCDRYRYKPILQAPLAPEVREYMTTISQYTDLELRLTDGKRGGRLEGIRKTLCDYGAEDALVVNK